MVRIPLIIGHRGASRDAPENTLAAFRLAWEQGADGIECDFRLTRDGRIVCIHDATTGRTAGVDLTVADASLDELRRLDAGAWKGSRWAGERIPLLEEVLALLPPGKRLLIELKSGPDIVPVLRDVLAGSGADPAATAILSFSEEVVAASRRVIPGCTVLWLCDYRRRGVLGGWHPDLGEVLAALERTSAHGLASRAHPCLDVPFAAALRERGRELHVWTV
ncbi:MAG TPA: glycerophosphodiester phosphodiesterase family protein, partial [Desulfuromonadaceae bacterium]